MDKYLLDHCPTICDDLQQAISDGVSAADLSVSPLYHIFGAWCNPTKIAANLRDEIKHALRFIGMQYCNLREFKQILQTPEQRLEFVYSVLAGDLIEED